MTDALLIYLHIYDTRTPITHYDVLVTCMWTLLELSKSFLIKL